jgi:hypothetical protein
MKVFMQTNHALLGIMLSKSFFAHSKQIDHRFLKPMKRGMILNAVNNIDDLYARLVVEYDWDDEVGPIISIQYAVSREPKCWFPSLDATYCTLVRLMEDYPQLEGFLEEFKKTWYFDSWMLLGDTMGIKEKNVQVIGDILQIGIPLFHEESKSLFGRSDEL